MADCRKYREIIGCYADGELSGNEKLKLQNHLEKCASCRSLLSLYASITATAEESMVEPPETFTDSIMSKIKALPENEQTQINAEKRPKKSLRPIIISFVAAAACLALAFIVSPGLFSLKGIQNSTAAVPMASAAPEAAYDAASEAATSEGDSLNAVMKSADEAAAASTAADSGAGAQATAVDDGSETTQVELGITAATPTPSPAPSSAPQYTVTGQNSADELRIYYAIFNIKGQLPDMLIEKSKLDNKNGTFNIEITAETANQLIRDGFDAELGAADSIIALVKYTPQS